MAIVIAFATQKGGVGKTTGTINLTAALARQGYKVLMVDLDPQGSLTNYFFGGENQLKDSSEYPGETVYDLLLSKKKVATIKLGPIELLPATTELAAAEIELSSANGREFFLSSMLGKHYQGFDFIILDCPPNLGIVTVNALTASQFVIIPVLTEMIPFKTLPLILSTIETITTEPEARPLNPELKIWTILPTMFESAKGQHKEVLDALRNDPRYASLTYPGDPVARRANYLHAANERADVDAIDSKLGAYWDALAEKLVADTKGSKSK